VTDQALAELGRSMRELGDVGSIVFNRRTGRLVGGNQRSRNLPSDAPVHILKRFEPATEAGTVAVGAVELDGELFAYREVDWSEEREAAAMVRANNPAGEWDDVMLGQLLGDLQSPEMLMLTGLDDASVARLLDGVRPPPPDDVIPAPDQAAELRKKWGTDIGQIWAVGDHRIMCGDATNPEQIDRLVNGASVALVVTSPPYNASIDYASHDDDMEVLAYLDMIRASAQGCHRSLMQGGFIAWNVGVSPKSMHFDHALILRSVGLTFYRQIIWAKAGVAFPIWQFTNGQARKYHPNYTHEMIYLFSKGDPLIGSTVAVDDAYSRDVWQIHQSQASVDLPGATDARRPRKPGVHGGSKAVAHPAAFPVSIPTGCIKHLSAPKERVLDPFVGSGSTIVACENEGRIGYGMDKDPGYIALTLERLSSRGIAPSLMP